MRRHLIVLAFLLLSPLAARAAVSDSAIKNEYCGVVAPVQLCKCAFHGQYCDGLGMSKSAAYAKLTSEYAAWKKKKTDALMMTCTFDETKEWKDGKCVTKKAGAKATATTGDAAEKEGGKEKPTCAQLYRLDENDACVFAGARGVRFSAESAEAFQAYVEGMATGVGGVFEGTDLKGKPIRLGVVRTPEGGYVFTGDGIRFFDNAKDAAAPGLWQRGSNLLDDIGRTVAGWFGIGKFSGRDTAGDAVKQEDGQLMLDASTIAFEAMKEKFQDTAEKDYEKAGEILDTWQGRIEAVVGEEYEDLLVDELGEATGLDTKTAKRVWEGEDWDKIKEGKFEDVQDDLLDDAKKALYGVPAETIKMLNRELRQTRFAASVRAYAVERDAGRSVEDVFLSFGRGDLPELEATDLKAHGNFYAREALFTAYEDAYQRYRVMKDLRKR